MDWVAPDACTLPTAEQPLRVAEFDDLLAAALRGLDRLSPTRLVFALDADPALEAVVRDLVARETECCSFFGFTVERVEERRLILDIGVPPERVDVLDALAGRAGAVLGSGAPT